MESIETDRYGKPLKEITVKEVVADLLTFPGEIIVSICAALIIAYEKNTWEETYKKLRTTDSNRNGKST